MAGLTEICASIKNYFCRDIKTGTFTLVSGTAPLTEILNGQYFRIVNSALNDGVWCNTNEDLKQLRSEIFNGEIWLMAVPRDFEELCNDIAEWRKKNEAVESVNMSPFTSESFGGYSYSKSGTSSGNGATTWKTQFAKRLNTYRRISV